VSYPLILLYPPGYFRIQVVLPSPSLAWHSAPCCTPSYFVELGGEGGPESMTWTGFIFTSLSLFPFARTTSLSCLWFLHIPTRAFWSVAILGRCSLLCPSKSTYNIQGIGAMFSQPHDTAPPPVLATWVFIVWCVSQFGLKNYCQFLYNNWAFSVRWILRPSPVPYLLFPLLLWRSFG